MQYAAINAYGTLGSWQTATLSLLTGESGATAAVANGYVYEIGGNNPSNSTLVQYASLGSGATLDGGMITDNNTSTTNTGINVASGILTIDDSAVISGGVLTIASTGELKITAGFGADGATPGGATLENLSVTNNNSTDGIEVDNGATLTLTDDFVYGGTITVQDAQRSLSIILK